MNSAKYASVELFLFFVQKMVFVLLILCSLTICNEVNYFLFVILLITLKNYVKVYVFFHDAYKKEKLRVKVGEVDLIRYLVGITWFLGR